MPTLPAGPDALDLTFRDATPGDAGALVPLFAELGHALPEADLAARLRRLVAIPGNRAVVAVQGGDRVVGLATLHLTPTLHRAADVGRITAFVVAPELQGRGVGRRLIAEAERLLAAEGCTWLELTSHRRRTDAHAFYEHVGWSGDGIRFSKTAGSR